MNLITKDITKLDRLLFRRLGWNTKPGHGRVLRAVEKMTRAGGVATYAALRNEEWPEASYGVIRRYAQDLAGAGLVRNETRRAWMARGESMINVVLTDEGRRLLAAAVKTGLRSPGGQQGEDERGSA